MEIIAFNNYVYVVNVHMYFTYGIKKKTGIDIILIVSSTYYIYRRQQSLLYVMINMHACYMYIKFAVINGRGTCLIRENHEHLYPRNIPSYTAVDINAVQPRD